MDNYATWIVVVSNRSRNKLSQQPPLSIFPKRKHKGFLSSILGNENSWTPEREVKGKSCPRLTIRQIRKEETNPSLKLWFLLSPWYPPGVHSSRYCFNWRFAVDGTYWCWREGRHWLLKCVWLLLTAYGVQRTTDPGMRGFQKTYKILLVFDAKKWLWII